MNNMPIARDLVLLGGGHSHALFLKQLAMNPIPGLQVTLVSPDIRTPYSGMLPGLVAGHYKEEEIFIDLVPLCRFAGARFIQARAKDIDPYDHRVDCEGRPSLRYDVLSINVGITPDLKLSDGEAEGIAVKPISDFLSKWQEFLIRVQAGEVKSVAVVGGGAGGVELCCAVNYRLHQLGYSTDVHLVVGSNLLSEYPLEIQSRFVRHLRSQGIHIHRDFPVASSDHGSLKSAHGEVLQVDETFWVTHAAAQSWLKRTGLPLTQDGFIKTRKTLQSLAFDDVFAVGDVGTVVDDPRPKAGVFAVRQAPTLYRNIKRQLPGKRCVNWRAQKNFLSLISVGGRYALGQKGRLIVEGRWVWRWKDWIDRRFMDQFHHLPEMKQPARSGLLQEFDQQMQCGGCGSKVSGLELSQALREVGLKTAELDDAAMIQVPEGHVLLQSVDGFKPFVNDPYRFAWIAAQHAMNDIYAMGVKPQSMLLSMTLPFGSVSVQRNILQQLLQGLKHATDAAGVSIIGGHTTIGAGLNLSLTVNAFAKPEVILKKTTPKVGDSLILTRPLGTGLIFAADGLARAKGEWVEAALGAMSQSNERAADCIVEHGASACTDVTGFGLAGHLLEMLRPSGLSGLISVGRLPCLPGAQELVETTQIRSTLHEGNRQSNPEVKGVASAIHSASKADIIFDPQTAGGLLVSVPAERADNCVTALREAGYPEAVVIGRVTEGGRTQLMLEA